MFTPPSEFEHFAESLQNIKDTLRLLGAEKAILKTLPKNANDKNQIYIASTFTPLHSIFDLTLAERGASSSLTKDKSVPGSFIPEAVFKNFAWVKRDGSLVKAKSVKVIIYTQYPEARLSGFISIENTMPQSLSVAYTKEHPDSKRLLVLGKLPGGACIALVYLSFPSRLAEEVAALPGLDGSKVCKILDISFSNGEKLFSQLAQIVSKPLKGCRLDIFGKTLPFTGTQVCGYTLEHALEIIPNAGKDGDLYGIELKTHTQLKVTLFTPEPDFGLYSEHFETFMRMYGYEASPGEWRVTGIHRANVRCKNSGLTLKIREYHIADPDSSKSDWVRNLDGTRKVFAYDPSNSLTSKMNAVAVVLEDDNGVVAAGWSLERLMNNWGVKHNEVIYISATKSDNPDPAEVDQGFAHHVTFAPKVVWCRDTSAEKLLNAIESGVIFLDPAPKFVEGQASKNKRRSQWRVNDISQAVRILYDRIEVRDLRPAEDPQPRLLSAV